MSSPLQRNKKIQSHKIITPTVPFLSELYIELPKPQTNRRISQTNNDQYYLHHHIQPPFSPKNNNQLIQSSQRYLDEAYQVEGKQRISSLSKTNCSFGYPSYQTEKEIICEWIRKIFKKKNLLGNHWEYKIQSKKKSLLRQAFECLKEQPQNIHSAYLQTQSKHRPYFRKQNHMITLGLQKLQEVISKLISKQKRSFFSSVLRFLAFQYNASRQGSKFHNLTFSREQSSHPYIRQAKHPPQLILNFHHNNKEVYLPQPKQREAHTIKHVQSAKAIPAMTNQYSLCPPPILKQSSNMKKLKKQNNVLVGQSIISKNSDRNAISRQLVNSKSQPNHFAVGGIGGNFKYQFNQHNYIVVQPEQHPFKHLNQQINYKPPSPLPHQFTTINGPQQPIINNTLQAGITPKPHQIKAQYLNPMRPRSHQQFVYTPNKDKNVSINEQMIESRRLRSNSLSTNIKIFFMNKQDHRIAQSKHKVSDYHTDQKQAFNNIGKLGTVQSKKQRQNYQINSYGNELIPQDYRQALPSPNYVHSVPISPMTKEFCNNIQIQGNIVNPYAPSTPSTPSNAHSKNTVYQSLMAIRQQQKSSQAKQMTRVPLQQEKRRNPSQKLAVTKHTKPK